MEENRRSEIKDKLNEVIQSLSIDDLETVYDFAEHLRFLPGQPQRRCEMPYNLHFAHGKTRYCSQHGYFCANHNIKNCPVCGQQLV